jgi:hypothetical protein
LTIAGFYDRSWINLNYVEDIPWSCTMHEDEGRKDVIDVS